MLPEPVPGRPHYAGELTKSLVMPGLDQAEPGDDDETEIEARPH